MEKLVKKLSDKAQEIVVGGPNPSVDQLENQIKEIGYVFIKFIETNGGTDLGVRIDNEDTDTNRFMKSGVSQVSIFSNYKYASIVKKPNVSVEEIISKIEKDTELIIIEGMKHSKYPKIEIIREEISKKSICEKENLIAIATDTKITSLNKELKFIPLSDTAKIAEIIMNYFQINDI